MEYSGLNLALGSLGVFLIYLAWRSSLRQGDTEEEAKRDMRWYELAGGYVLMGAGGVLLGWQCFSYSFQWLQHGDAVWPDWSLYGLMAPYFSWLTSPQEWIGLHEIVSACFKFVGLSGILFVCGFLLNYGITHED